MQGSQVPMGKKIIIPSAPFKNYQELEELAMKAKGEVKRIQIDVCDGKYVSSVSWPFTEFTNVDFEKLGDKSDFDSFLPFWENINYSADLMCENPEKYLQTIVAYGIDEIIIHFRSLQEQLPRQNLADFATHSKEGEFRAIVEKCKLYELNLILAVDVKTDLKEFMKFVQQNIQNINGFQVMGIEKIGFQGQLFVPKSLEIVKKLKKEFPEKLIYFDGGEDEETIPEIVDAGVDIFCVGHFLTKAENFEENLQIIKNLIR